MTVKENYFNSSRMTARHDHQYQHPAKKKILTRPYFDMFKRENLCYIHHGHSSSQDLLTVDPFLASKFFALASFASLELVPAAFLFLLAAAFPAFVHAVSSIF